MANYHEMDRDALTAEKAALEQAYKEFQAKGLKLNMARGKPGPHQMDLAMDLLMRLYISCRLELPPTNTSLGFTPNTSANRARASLRPSSSP